MGKDRPFRDGGGPCSPGRWPRAKRILPAGVGEGFFCKFKGMMAEYWKKFTSGKEELHMFALRLAARRFEENPFDEGFMAEGLKLLKGEFGLKEEDLVIDAPQCFR